MSVLLGRKTFVIVFSIIICTILIDTSLARLTGFGFTHSSSQSGQITFFLVIIAAIVGQNIILAFIKSKTSRTSINFQLNLNLIFKLITLSQYVVAALLLAIFSQVTLTQGYDPTLMKVLIWISYLQTLSIIAFLLYKFLSWLIIHSSLAVLLYTIAVGSLCMNVLFTVLHVNELIVGYSPYVTSGSSMYFPDVNPGSVLTIGFQTSSILSYLLMWIATVVLLRSHSRKLGRIRYWGIVAMPLIYFLIQFPSVVLQLFATYRLSNPVAFSEFYTIFFAMSKPIGGILFAVAFWSTGKRIQNVHIKDFMIISAYGLILFFSSNQAIILASFPLPPFGLVTISFIGLAAFLLLVGIYSSALSIAHDSTLRSSIRSSLEEAGFLDKIGDSETERFVKRRVTDLSKSLSNLMENESGVESSLDDNDVKSYMEEVLTEIKRKGANT